MTAAQFCQTWGIHATTEQVNENPFNPDWSGNHYRIVLHYTAGQEGERKRRAYTTYFTKGLALEGKPNVAEVIECLSRDIYGVEDLDFEDWCGEYGYETDSRQAEKIYMAIVKQAQDIQNWLSAYPNAYAQFQNIEEAE